MILSYTQSKEELKAQPAHAPSCDRKIAEFHRDGLGFSGNADFSDDISGEEDDEDTRDYYTVMAERCPPRE